MQTKMSYRKLCLSNSIEKNSKKKAVLLHGLNCIIHISMIYVYVCKIDQCNNAIFKLAKIT